MEGLELLPNQRTLIGSGARIPVVCRGEGKGHLWVTAEHLCFAACGGNFQKWTWESLHQVSANAAMRITFLDKNNKSLFFQFEDPLALLEATREFQARIRLVRPNARFSSERSERSILSHLSRSDHFSVASQRSARLPSTSHHRSDPASHSRSDFSVASHGSPQTEQELVSLVDKLVEKKLQESRTNNQKPAAETTDHLSWDIRMGEEESGEEDSDLEEEEEYKEESGITLRAGNTHSWSGPRSQEEFAALVDAAIDQRLEKDWAIPQTREEFVALMDTAIDERLERRKTDTNNSLVIGGGNRDNTNTTFYSERETYRDLPIKDGFENEDDNSGYMDPSIKEKKIHAPLGETVYSLLYLCKFRSQGFWYAVFVYGIQMSTIMLTLMDIVDEGSENPFQIPPMVDLTVTFAQAFAVFMAVAYQSDLIEAVIKLQDGFYPQLLEKFPGATYNTWMFSIVAQIASGILLLILSFILTMQVTTVVDGMLNLTALLFMGEIDDVGFSMAKMGFVRSSLQALAETVVEIRVPKRPRRNIQRRLLYLLILLCFFVCYGFIKHRQLNGHYLQTYLYVQFGDSYDPKLPFYSGILSSQQKRSAGFREYRDEVTGNILLAYCQAEKSWTFSEGDDPCDYFAKSSESTSYDVTSINAWEWQVKDINSRLHPFDSFSLVGRDCNEESCNGVCGKDGLCECPHDKFGLDCEFSNVCPELIIDGKSGYFPLTQQYGNDFVYEVDRELELLKDNETNEYIRVYNMPVYYATSGTAPAAVIFFSGRRWVITTEWDLIHLTEEEKNSAFAFFPDRTAAVLKKDFHGYHQAKYVPLFLSDPVDFETPNFLPSPSGLGWWSVRVVDQSTRHYTPGSRVSAVYHCKTCLSDQGEFCGVQGICNITTGLCDCKTGFKGAKCEEQIACYEQDWPCYGDGVCDQISGVCRCNQPFGGKLCEAADYCTDQDECQNGGVCDTDTGVCICPVDHAIGGFNCEKFADCHVYGCGNGGVCALNGKCVCRPPFYGVLCNLVDATEPESTCSNDIDCMDGTCNTTTGICSCENPNSYGTLCQYQYNCSWGGCRNSGSCNEASGLCECSDPFFGVDCGNELACFDDTYCEEMNGLGSICDNTTETCKCGGLSSVGKSCYYNCKIDGCYNGGICNQHGKCECPIPYTGLACDFLATDVSVENNIMQRVEACVAEHGFPPYNGTDCRTNQFNEP